MMSFPHFKSIFTLLLCLVLMSSCKKEGCTDPDADNFCSDCKSDDNSCTYSGRNTFWYDAETSQALVADEATALKFYVDGVLIGSTAAEVFWLVAPNCDTNGSITVSKSLGNNKSGSFSYSVTDDTGYEYWLGTFTIKANTCTSDQLIF